MRPRSYQLSAISYQLSAISYQLSAISYQLSAISYQLSAISYQLSASEGIEVAGYRNFLVVLATKWLPREIDGHQTATMGDFRKLNVWKKARALVDHAYRITKSFPPEERYGLAAQLRSASTSILANIAEGCGRNRDREFRRFLLIALGSATEVETLVVSAHDQKILDEAVAIDITHKVMELRRMLAGLSRRLDHS